MAPRRRRKRYQVIAPQGFDGEHGLFEVVASAGGRQGDTRARMPADDLHRVRRSDLGAADVRAEHVLGPAVLGHDFEDVARVDRYRARAVRVDARPGRDQGLGRSRIARFSGSLELDVGAVAGGGDGEKTGAVAVRRPRKPGVVAPF